jgi:hypothetical protein
MEDWKYGSTKIQNCQLSTVNKKNPPGKTRGKVKQVAMVFVLGVTGLTDGI